MRKHVYILFSVSILSILFFSVLCGKKESKSDMNEKFYKEFKADDSQPLENVLTRDYELSELRAYFEGSNVNENIGFGISNQSLTFTEVNQHYPIEVIRTGGYSVYNVSQGGYFYVFWAQPLIMDESLQNDEPSVYFTAYILSSIKQEKFNSLKKESSTAQDVKKIDPFFELSFLISNGIYSYSFLDDNTVMEIEYTSKGEFDNYEDLIIKNMETIARSDAPSRFCSILSKDIP